MISTNILIKELPDLLQTLDLLVTAIHSETILVDPNAIKSYCKSVECGEFEIICARNDWVSTGPFFRLRLMYADESFFVQDSKKSIFDAINNFLLHFDTLVKQTLNKSDQKEIMLEFNETF